MERTLAIIKPDGVEKQLMGKIIEKISDAGFKVIAIKMMRLSKESAMGFYEIHKDRPFYNDLVSFMTSGFCIPIALEKDNAVEDFRKLIGATDPQKAAVGTIRRMFAESIEKNVIHGSDSPENAKIEINHFFSRNELLG